MTVILLSDCLTYFYPGVENVCVGMLKDVSIVWACEWGFLEILLNFVIHVNFVGPCRRHLRKIYLILSVPICQLNVAVPVLLVTRHVQRQIMVYVMLHVNIYRRDGLTEMWIPELYPAPLLQLFALIHWLYQCKPNRAYRIVSDFEPILSPIAIRGF